MQRPIGNLRQGQFKVGDKSYVGVNTDHSAEYFNIDTNEKTLNYIVSDVDGVTKDVSVIVPFLYGDKTYRVLGTYKSMENKSYFRNAMLNVGMHLDYNWVLLEEV